MTDQQSIDLKRELTKLVALLRDGYDGAVKAREQDALYRIGDAINLAQGCLYTVSDKPAGTIDLPKAITASVMIHEDPKAYCVMAAFRTEAEALSVLSLI